MVTLLALFMIFISAVADVKILTLLYVTLYHNFRWCKTKSALMLNTKWFAIFEVQKVINFFIQCIKTAIDNHAPLVKLSRRLKPL